MTLVQTSQGIGLKFPERDQKHSDPHWFECDLDDPEADDPEGPDPLPTDRHRQVP